MIDTLLRPFHVLLENARFAFRALLANRLRAALTTLGIVIGVATVIIMVAIVQGFETAVVGSATSFGATLVQFQKFEPRFGHGRERPEYERNRRDLTLADALAIKELSPSIAAVSPERYLFTFGGQEVAVKAEGRVANGTSIAGVYPDYMVANNHFVADGRFITDADVLHATSVVVIGNDVVQALFPQHDPIGRHLDIGNHRYVVIGVFERKGSAFGGSNDSFAMIPLSSFDQQFPHVKNGGGDTIHIATVPRKPEWVSRAVDEGTAVLRMRRGLKPGDPDDFAVYTPDKLLAQTESLRNGIAGVILFIASTALIVGGVGVMNVMLVAVTERTREIGTRMALGARRRDIIIQFLTESATLTGMGGAIGIAIALGVVVIVRQIGMPAVAAPWAVALGLGVSIAIGLFFGLYPAIKAARLAPIEALRYE